MCASYWFYIITFENKLNKNKKIGFFSKQIYGSDHKSKLHPGFEIWGIIHKPHNIISNTTSLVSSIRDDRIKYRSASWILRRYFWISAEERHRVPDLGGFASDSDFLFFYKHARGISWKFSTGHGRAQQKIQVPLGFPRCPRESQRTNIQVLNTQRQILHFSLHMEIFPIQPTFYKCFIIQYHLGLW